MRNSATAYNSNPEPQHNTPPRNIAEIPEAAGDVHAERRTADPGQGDTDLVHKIVPAIRRWHAIMRRRGRLSPYAPVCAEQRDPHTQADKRPQPDPFERERREVVAPENGGLPRPLQRPSVQGAEGVTPVQPEAVEEFEPGIEQCCPLRRKIAEGRTGLQADM